MSKIVNEEREKRVELYKEMDEKLKVVYEYINMYKSTSELANNHLYKKGVTMFVTPFYIIQ
jgi:hypothetical protein